MRMTHAALALLVGAGTVAGAVPAAAAAPVDYAIPAGATTMANVARIIRADTAWSQGWTGKGVGVALIDTGVAPVPGLTSGNVVNGPDLSLESQVPSLRGKDGYGHGTHMAGIIAGRDNTTGTGFRGIAPDAKLTALKVGMSNGAVDITQVIAAIDWVVQHRNDDPKNPIKIINLSYGVDAAQPYSTDPLSYAVANAVKAGVVVVTAAGNTGSKVTTPSGAYAPLSIGSSDAKGTTNPADDTTSVFSAGDRPFLNIDVEAPGQSIVSLRVPGGYADTFYPSARVGDRFFKGSGTSQAAAVASGAIALYYFTGRAWSGVGWSGAIWK